MERYTSARLLAGVLVGFGWLVLLYAVQALVGAIEADVVREAAGGVIATAGGGLLLWAAGVALRILVDIEEHQRAIREAGSREAATSAA